MPLRRAVPLGLCVLLLAGCGNALRREGTALGARQLEGQLQVEDGGKHFAGLHCAPDRVYGWDYLCTYTDRQTGKAMRMAFTRGRRSGTGSYAADEPLQYGPHAREVTAGVLTARADRFCTARARDAAALPSPRTTAELAATAAKLALFDSLLATRLGSLKPNGDDKDDFHAFLAAVSRRSRAYHGIRDALASGTAATARVRAAQLVSVRHSVARAADKLGIDCAG